MTVTPTTTLRVDFVSESAAYENVFGWYNKATGMGGILFADVEQEGRNAPLVAGQSSVTFTVNTADVGNIEFFLIPNGYNINKEDAGDLSGPIKVIQLSDGSWAVADVDSHGNVITNKNGKPDILNGAGANALFTETSKNAGGTDYASSVAGSNQTAATLAGDTADGPTGLIAWEDLAATRNKQGGYGKPGDADYNDAVFRVSIVGQPPVANADAVSVSEDAGVTTINVLANDTDPDAGDTLHVTSVNIAGVIGTVTIAAGGGSILYTPAASFQSLRAGQTATETFSYTVADQAGHTANANVTVTIVGANDGPVAVNDSNAADPVVESGVNPGNTPFAGDAVASGNVLTNDTDVDAGDTKTVTSTGAFAGTYGSVTINANGSYTYTLNNGLAATNALAQGEVASDVFSYTMRDAAGATSTATLTINVTGTNDAPVITGGPTAGAVQEDGTTQVSGQLLASDPDHNATKTWTVVGGSQSTSADYHFRADSFIITRNGGPVLQDDFSDGLPPPNSPNFANGNSTTYAGVGGFTESSGKLFLDSNNAGAFVGVGTPDPIIGQDALARTNIDPSNLTAGLKSNASFTVEGVFDLILPDSPREEYGVRVMDRLIGGPGTPPDQPGNDTIELVVRMNLSGALTVALRRIDFASNVTTQIESVPLVVPPGADQIHLKLDHVANATTIGASFDYLQSNVVVASQTFASTPTIFQGENWTRGDIVADAPAMTDSTLGGTYGTLNVSQSGTWNYVLNNGSAATEALAQGQHVTDTFQVKVTDQFGASDVRTVNIDVAGTNDAPILLTGATTRSLTEDSQTPNLTATGLAQFSDVDLTNTHTVTTALQSSVLSGVGSVPPAVAAELANALIASLTDLATGDAHGEYQWNFSVPNSDVQFLALGQTLTLNYQVTVTDNSGASATQNVTVTLTGTNDAPVITGAATASLQEDTIPLVQSGQLVATDVDNGATQTWSIAGGTSVPQDYNVYLDEFKIIRNGSTYFDDTFSDGIAPPNAPNTGDGPVSYGVGGTGATIFESAGRALFAGTNGVVNGPPFVNGFQTAGQSATLQTNNTNALNGLGLKKDMTFTVEGRFDLSIPADVRDQYAVRLSDNNNLNQGDNTVSLSVRRDADGVHVSLIEINFATATATTLQQINLNPLPGDDQIVLRLEHLTANSTTVTAAFDLLDNGVVTSTTTFTPANAAHIFDNEQWVQAQITANGLPETDSVLTGTYSTLTVDQDGTWNARVRNGQAAVQALAEGETVTDTFTVQVTDDKGAVTTKPVTVNVTGTNDAPVITSGATTGAVQEDDNPLATGALTATDVDHGAVITWSVVGGQPVNADFVFAIDEFKVIKGGNLLFDDTFSDGLAPPNAPNLNAGTPTSTPTSYGTPAGSTFIEMLDHVVMYGPLGPAPTAGVGPGAPNFVSDGATLLTSIDPNLGENGLGLRIGSTFSVEGRYESLIPEDNREAYGIRLTDRNLPTTPTSQNPTNPGNDVLDLSVRRDADGHLAVQFRDLDFQANSTPVLLGEVAVTSAMLGHQIVLRLNHATAGSNDITASFDTIDDFGNVTSYTVPGVGHIFTDETYTRAQFIGSEPVENVSFLYGQYGALTVDQQGNWKYILDNNNPNTQALAEGETVTDTFQIRATDEHGAFDTKTINVTVTGNNDAPVITGGVTSGIVQEDTINQATGTLNATDVDHGAIKTWNVVGGNPGHTTNYSVTIDEFKIVKTVSGTPTTIFDDTFTGTFPPTGPAGQPPYIGTNNQFTGANGRAVMDDEHSGTGFSISDPSLDFTGLPTGGIGNWAQIGTNIDPSNTMGLKSGTSFSISGVYDLIQSEAGYGIRLANTNGAINFAGNDVVDFNVRTGGPFGPGSLYVQLTQIDFTVPNGATTLQQLQLNPSAGDDQILLTLTHDASTNGVVTASFSLLNHGVVDYSATLNFTGHIFDHTNWVRGGFEATAPGNTSSFVNGIYGQLAINQSGTWTYQLDNSRAVTQALAQDETATDTFTVQVTDEHGASAMQTINIAVKGTNDAPVITGPHTASLKEDTSPLVQTGQLVATDPDHGATQTWSIANNNGATVPQDYNVFLDEFKITRNGSTYFDDTFSDNSAPPSVPMMTDGTTHSYNVGQAGATILESNGHALLAGTNAVINTGPQINGFASAGQSATLGTDNTNALNGTGLKKDMTFTVEGKFDLSIPADVRDQYAVRLSDNTSSNTGDNTVSLSVRRDADGVHVSLIEINFATASATTLQAINLNPLPGDDQIVLRLEHLTPGSTTVTASFDLLNHGVVTSTTSFSSTAHAFDNENWVQAQFLANGLPESDSVLTGTYSTLTVDQDGTWTARVRNGQAAVQALAEGETVTETFNVQVTDDKGAVTTQPVTVNVTGTNDAAIFTGGITTGAVQEDGAQTAGAVINALDVDHGAVLAYNVVGGNPGDVVQGTYGSLSVSQSGVWFYTLANSQPNVQALAQGQSVIDTFQVRVADQFGAFFTQAVNVTVTGSNDAPVAAPTSAQANEDSGNPVTLSAIYNDPDAGQGHTYSINTAGTLGLVINNNDGTFSYNPNGQFEGLPIDGIATDSFIYTVTDAAGASSSATATVTIHGENDTTFIADGSVNAAATKNGAGTQLLVGSGIPASHFGLLENDSGIELGMQVIYRQGPTVTTADNYNDGVLHFSVNSGAQSTANGSSSSNAARAAWSFDYSIATGLNGQTTNLSDYTFKLVVDVDPSSAVNSHILRLVPDGGINSGAGHSGYVWIDDSVFASGAGTIDGHPIVIADDSGSANVTQNSENYAFGFVQNYLTSTYGPSNGFSGPAHFDIELQAYKSATLLAANHIVVDVNSPPPAPAAMSVSGFTTLTYPVVTPPGHGAAPAGHGQAVDINNAGQIVGLSETYDDGSIQGLDGWVYNNGSFTTVHIGNQNAVSDINSFGAIAGSYSPGNSTPRYGFIESSVGGSVTTINLSPNISTDLQGINDAGNYVGSSFQHAGNFYSGFMTIAGVTTYLNPFGSNDAHANGINNLNDVIGTYTLSGVVHSFLYHNGVFSNVDKAGATDTISVDINSAGQIAGYYRNSVSDPWHGFINTNGVFTTIDHPLATGSGGTAVNGFNDAGQLVGAYYDSSNVPHAYVATINNPSGQSTNDVLVASPQGSTLVGGAGNDTFVFNAAPQTQSTIADFVHGQDILQISAAGFDHGLTTGAIPTLLSGSPAAVSDGPNGYFIFDNGTPGGGTLYYDATGGSGADAVALVKLQGVTTLLPSDFHVV